MLLKWTKLLYAIVINCKNTSEEMDKIEDCCYEIIEETKRIRKGYKR